MAKKLGFWLRAIAPESYPKAYRNPEGFMNFPAPLALLGRGVGGGGLLYD